MKAGNPKIRAAAFSITGATSLAIIKLFVALTSGSMAVMASAVDSLLDILMSGVNFMAIRQAEQPADDCHPFGHGQFETLATFFQAFVICCSGGWIIYEAIQRIRPGEPTVYTRLGEARLGQGEVDGALRDFEAALRASPRDLDALVGMARCRLRKGHDAVAERLLRRVLEQRPGHRLALRLGRR